MIQIFIYCSPTNFASDLSMTSLKSTKSGKKNSLTSTPEQERSCWSCCCCSYSWKKLSNVEAAVVVVVAQAAVLPK